MSFTEAVKRARKFPHGSYYHQQAMTVLFNAYKEAHNCNSFIELKDLWEWVDTQI